MPPTDAVRIELSRSEALVLYEYLRRCDDADQYAFVDQAEQRALWKLECALEPQIGEIFDPSYGELLRAARAAVRDME